MVYTTLLLDFMLHIKVCDDKVVVWISGDKFWIILITSGCIPLSLEIKKLDNCSKRNKILKMIFVAIRGVKWISDEVYYNNNHEKVFIKKNFATH